jgi:hypothetical protein
MAKGSSSATSRTNVSSEKLAGEQRPEQFAHDVRQRHHEREQAHRRRAGEKDAEEDMAIEEVQAGAMRNVVADSRRAHKVSSMATIQSYRSPQSAQKVPSSAIYASSCEA